MRAFFSPPSSEIRRICIFFRLFFILPLKKYIFFYKDRAPGFQLLNISLVVFSIFFFSSLLFFIVFLLYISPPSGSGDNIKQNPIALRKKRLSFRKWRWKNNNVSGFFVWKKRRKKGWSLEHAFLLSFSPFFLLTSFKAIF